MRKQTISALLTALMICLTIAIIVLIIRIQMRAPVTEEQADSNSYIEQDDPEVQNTDVEEPDGGQVVETVLIAITNANSSVNVRSGPGTDYERVGSAYPNNEYEVLEILAGWTRILYSDQEAYISNDYIDYKFRRTDSSGNIFYDVATEESLSEYMSSGAVTEDTENDENNETE